MGIYLVGMGMDTVKFGNRNWNWNMGMGIRNPFMQIRCAIVVPLRLKPKTMCSELNRV